MYQFILSYWAILSAKITIYKLLQIMRVLQNIMIAHHTAIKNIKEINNLFYVKNIPSALHICFCRGLDTKISFNQQLHTMNIFLRFYEFSFPLRSNTMKKLIKHSSLWLCKWFSSSPVFIFSQKLFWLGIGILCFSFPFLVWPVREIIKMISNSYGVPLQKVIKIIWFFSTRSKIKKKSKTKNKSLYAYFLWTGGGATTK